MDMNFQYVKIDDESLDVLRRLDLREQLRNEKVELDKWSVNADHTIALLRTGYVSSGIARVDDNSSFWFFHLVANGIHGNFSISRRGYSLPSVKPEEVGISADFAERCGLSQSELNVALCEALKVLEKGRDDDYKEEKRLRDLERTRRMPGIILQGRFSELLRRCVDSVVEFQDMENKFRWICLRHFKEYNIAVQHYGVFYLHDDEDSFFVYDVVLWMYLHVNRVATINKFSSDYALIANASASWRSNADGEFYLGGSAHFLSEKYLPQRIENGLILVENDVLRFSKGHLEWLIQQLENVKDPVQ